MTRESLREIKSSLCEIKRGSQWRKALLTGKLASQDLELQRKRWEVVQRAGTFTRLDCRL
jgi:hypothetical protein